MNAPDHLLDASRHLRAVIDAHPELAELAEVDAAIGRAIKGRPTSLRRYFGAAHAALAAAETAAEAALASGGGGETEPDGEPTQATALRAAADLTATLPRSTRITVTPNQGGQLGDLGIQVHGGDGEQLAALTTLAAQLARRRDLYAHGEPGENFHVWLAGDHPGTKIVRLSACLHAAPDADALAALRALCGGGGE